MPQRDYILREIEKLGEFLAALRRRILVGLDRDGAAAVRTDIESMAQRADINPILLRSLTAETLALMMRDRAGADPVQCWLWAEFLYLDGLTALAEGDDVAAHDRLAKALMLYSLLGAPLTGAWLEQVPDRIEEIKAILDS